jgi:hypothetical protein
MIAWWRRWREKREKAAAGPSWGDIRIRWDNLRWITLTDALSLQQGDEGRVYADIDFDNEALRYRPGDEDPVPPRPTCWADRYVV